MKVSISTTWSIHRVWTVASRLRNIVVVCQQQRTSVGKNFRDKKVKNIHAKLCAPGDDNRKCSDTYCPLTRPPCTNPYLEAALEDKNALVPIPLTDARQDRDC
jgi:hypothetical protein